MIRWQYWTIEVETSVGRTLDRTDLACECEDVESYKTLENYLYYKGREPIMSQFKEDELTEFYKEVKHRIGAQE